MGWVKIDTNIGHSMHELQEQESNLTLAHIENPLGLPSETATWQVLRPHLLEMRVLVLALISSVLL